MAKKKKRKKRDSYEEGTGYYGPQPTLQENITATAPVQQAPPQAAAPPPQAAAPPPQVPQQYPPGFDPTGGGMGLQTGANQPQPIAPRPELAPPNLNPGWQGGNVPPPQQGAPVEPDTNPLPTPQQQAPDYNVPERSTPERHAERYGDERYGEYRPPDEKIGRNARSDEQYKSGRMDRGLELVDQEQQTLDAVFEGGSDKQRMKWKRMYDRDGSGHFDDQERQHMYHDMNQWAKEKYGKQDLAGLVDEGTLLRRRKEAEPPTLSEVAEEPEVIHDPVGYREEQGRPSRRELLGDVKGAVDEQLGRRPLPLPGGGTVDPETMELNPREYDPPTGRETLPPVREYDPPTGRETLPPVREPKPSGRMTSRGTRYDPPSRKPEQRTKKVRVGGKSTSRGTRGGTFKEVPVDKPSYSGGTASRVKSRKGLRKRVDPDPDYESPGSWRKRHTEDGTFKLPQFHPDTTESAKVKHFRKLISEGKIKPNEVPRKYR